MTDLRKFGYAPGNYIGKCQNPACRTTEGPLRRVGQFMGDKRAWSCEPCAQAAHDAAAPRPAKKIRTPQLVRDKMVPRQGFNEANVKLPLEVAVPLLIGKIHGEIEEVALDLTNPEEYADVLEALMSLAMLMGVDPAKISAAAAEKGVRKGGLRTANLWIPEFFNKEYPDDVQAAE